MKGARIRGCFHSNARPSLVNGELKTFCTDCKQWLVTRTRELPDAAACAAQMPFGKYAGKRFDELPISYLEWATKNLKGALARRAEQVLRVLESRGKTAPPASDDEPRET